MAKEHLNKNVLILVGDQSSSCCIFGFLTLELRTFLYTFVYGGVVFDTDARNVKHKL